LGLQPINLSPASKARAISVSLSRPHLFPPAPPLSQTLTRPPAPPWRLSTPTSRPAKNHGERGSGWCTSVRFLSGTFAGRRRIPAPPKPPSHRSAGRRRGRRGPPMRSALCLWPLLDGRCTTWGGGNAATPRDQGPLPQADLWSESASPSVAWMTMTRGCHPLQSPSQKGTLSPMLCLFSRPVSM
jgi:hypothetical protein